MRGGMKLRSLIIALAVLFLLPSVTLAVNPDEVLNDPALELRARIVEHGERKSVVACSVRQGSVECATAEVITVRVKGRY